MTKIVKAAVVALFIIAIFALGSAVFSAGSRAMANSGSAVNSADSIIGE